MIDDFLIKYHPWILLKESLTFPDKTQLVIMKGIMDGKSIDTIAHKLSITSRKTKRLLAEGMKIADVKNLYELVLWGLKTGIIHDEPIEIPDELKRSPYESHSPLISYLCFITSGYTPHDISDIGRIGIDTQNHYRKFLAQKFNLGYSYARFIRFAFQTTNPINPPKQIKMYRPHKALVSPHQTLKYPPVVSKFKPANIDPNVRYVYQTTTGKGINATIKTAFKVLGVDPRILNKNYSFWKARDEWLWTMLELAKKRYDYEISHAHPDRGGNVNRAKQINIAWKFIKDMFKKRGYELHGSA